MSTAPLRTHRGPLIGALVRMLHQSNTERLARWLAGSRYRDLQPAHAAAIQPLWQAPEGLRITALAGRARVTKQSMSALIDHLEACGYVERVADPDDARATLVRLTGRGRAYGRAVREFGRDLEADWARRVGARRMAELCATLELLEESLREGEPAP